jgi:hypothetical protein
MNNKLFEDCVVVVWKNKGIFPERDHWAHVRAHINGALCLCEQEPEHRETLDFLYAIANQHAKGQ